MIRFTYLPIIIIFFLVSPFYLFSQKEYDEKQIKEELEVYLANPKKYYDKMNLMKNQINTANKNSIETAEEYLKIIDEKDSIIASYKAKLAKSSRQPLNNTSASSSIKKPTEEIASTSNITSVNNSKLPYRVQLSSFQSERLKSYLEVPKLLMFSTLNNRNVFEISGFNSAKEAFEFSQELRLANVPGAFVTKYVNGSRDDDFNYLKSDPKAISEYKKEKFGPSKNNKIASTNITSGFDESLDYPTTEPVGYYQIKGIQKKPSSSINSENDSEPETKTKKTTPNKSITSPNKNSKTLKYPNKAPNFNPKTSSSSFSPNTESELEKSAEKKASTPDEKESKKISSENSNEINYQLEESFNKNFGSVK